VQRRLRTGETVVAEQHPNATILWAEVDGLTQAASEVPALQLVVLINSLYAAWEALCEQVRARAHGQVGEGVWTAG
jgi:class 3 adenylate cyclase